MDKKKLFIILIIIIFIGIYIFVKNKLSVEEYTYVSTENMIVSSETEELEESEDTIKVHVTGEVLNTGLIELKTGSRIYDAIEECGGTTDLADVSKVNLAYILSDGEKIYIPSINDEDDVDYILNSESNSKVNINTATAEQLETLNGIGESLAAAIIAYREENGNFSSIEDIKNVSGIGDSKFEKIKDYISVK